jgi:sugar lactone lactonase YvrE
MAAVPQEAPQRAPCPAVMGEVRSVWTAQALHGAAPLWSVRESALYWVDTVGQQLHRFQPKDQLRDSWSLGARTSAIAERADQAGLLLALQHELVFFDPHTGRLQGLHRVEPGQTSNQLSAGQCDAQGRFWLCSESAHGAPATGALYRYHGGSRCTRVLKGLNHGAGFTWSRDQRTLYVSDPAQGTVSAYASDPELGTLGPAQRWLTLNREDGSPRGMCTDAAGRIWLAHYGAGSVRCYQPESAQELLRIPVPASRVTACAFGGRDLRTLFITTASPHTNVVPFGEPLAGALFAAEVSSPGLSASLFVV